MFIFPLKKILITQIIDTSFKVNKQCQKHLAFILLKKRRRKKRTQFLAKGKFVSKLSQTNEY
jgi:hypothetical protein